MFTINRNVVFVQGAKNGAIYDFNSGKVFWINRNSCNVINKIINSKEPLNKKELEYIDQLVKEKLYNYNFEITKYVLQESNFISLEMAWLEVTQACNCKCLHCYQGDKHCNSSKTLSINKWKEIITELKFLQVKRVIIIGGEPCTYKYINQIIQFLCANEIQTTLFTNGTLFTDELKKTVIDNKKYVKIKVSLYGYNNVTHDNITQVKGSFEKLNNIIDFFHSNKVDVDIAVVAMKENQDILENIKQYITSLNIKYSGYDVIRNVFGGTQDKHTPDRYDVVSKAKFSKPEFYASEVRFNNNANRNSCWYGKLAITENGDVLPCVFERNLLYGNVNNQSLTDILSSESSKENWFRDFSKIDCCKDCEFRFACKDCRPLGKSVNGLINEKNPRCMYNPQIGEWGRDCE